MPRESDQSDREQHDRHELQRILDMTDEEQLESDAHDAHHHGEKQKAPKVGKPLAVQLVTCTNTGHEKTIVTRSA
jgi:hypothetical protein